ncbi:MAG: hypothetical protein ACXAEX_19800 [Promethearchaeota archaeon]|jgi:chromosome segregation ATPase
MVFKNIERIKVALPEVLHIVMFYNSGTVFQSTFGQEINVPKLGDNLTGLLNHIKNVYEVCNFRLDDYKKLMFETEDISVIILKLGEESNIALFFKEEDLADIKLSSIKRYLTRIEELIDMDEKEIILQQILAKEKELKKNQEDLQSKQQTIQHLQEELKNLGTSELQEEMKNVERELFALEEECIKLDKNIININEEIRSLRDLIEKD